MSDELNTTARIGWSQTPMAHLLVDIEGLTDPDDARRYANVCRDMAVAQRERGQQLDAAIFYGLAEGLDRWSHQTSDEHRAIADAFRAQLDTNLEEISRDPDA